MLRTGHIVHFELSTNMTACNGNNISMMLQHQLAFCVLCFCKSILHVSSDSVDSWVRLSLLVHWGLIAKCPPRLVQARGSGNRISVAYGILYEALLCHTIVSVCSGNCIRSLPALLFRILCNHPRTH